MLANNGGPTETIALLSGSPAIDAGSNDLAVDAQGDPLATDQRGTGFPRIVNGTVDIGAFEFQPAFTMTSISAVSPNPSVFGEAVTFTATVAVVAPGSGTPTGSVTFLDNGNPFATVPLKGRRAILTTKTLAAGTHEIQAEYVGDTDYLPSLSALVKQTVNQDSSKTSIVSSDHSSVFGEAVTFTAKVTAAAPGAGTPTGSVTFSVTPTSARTVFYPVNLDAKGQATISLGDLAVGKYSITASYGGDVDFTTSISRALKQTVNLDGTTTTVISSYDPSVYGEPVTFTATVAAAPGSGTPTGTVTFYDGKTELGTVQLTNGSAAFTTSSLAVGTDKMKVLYSGDTSFKSSKMVLDQVVSLMAPAVESPIHSPGGGRNIAVAGALAGLSTGQLDDPAVPIALGVIDAAIEALDGQGRDEAIPPHKASQAVPAQSVAINASIQ